jgi:single-stranded-DNA-specific exonuclease
LNEFSILKNWVEKHVPKIPQNVKNLRLNPITLRLLAQRGFFSVERIEKFLNSRYEDLHSSSELGGISAAVEIINKAKNENKSVTIYGDYDADGITSTILLQEVLEKIGIKATTYIPDRNKEGYGLNFAALDYIKKEFGTELLITVDCGISNISEIAYARKLNIEVIVVDHHAIPKKLPSKCVIIDPKLPGQKYGFRDLAGVGVTFKLAHALWEKIIPEKVSQLKWFLDLVAIGTIADCVPLVDENRIFAKFGLIVLQKTKRVGIQELIKTARLKIDEKNPPNAENIAFQIGPRFNAAGRIDHADLTLKLLSENDRREARILALELESKNTSRQKITQVIYDEIKRSLDPKKDYKLIIRKGKNWPLGIVGVVAGKIADEFNCPTFILRAKDDIYEGSGRSIDNFDLIAAISKIDNLLEKYGGHAQALGIKIKPANLAKFEKKLHGLIDLAYNEDAWGNKVHVDAEINANQIDWDLISEIRKLEPFGEGNEEPIFITKNFFIEKLNLVGNGQKHLKLVLLTKSQKNRKFEAIYFKGAGICRELKGGDNVTLIYKLRSNEWNGSHKIEINVIQIIKNAQE